MKKHVLMDNTKAAENNNKPARRFVPKATNFKVSASYEGLAASGKVRTLESLKRQYARQVEN